MSVCDVCTCTCDRVYHVHEHDGEPFAHTRPALPVQDLGGDDGDVAPGAHTALPSVQGTQRRTPQGPTEFHTAGHSWPHEGARAPGPTEDTGPRVLGTITH